MGCKMKRNIDKASVFTFALSLALGSLVSWKAQPYIHNNSEAVNIIVTTFSILAGFLVTIMTVIAAPSHFTERSWRYYSLRRDVVKVKLSRHKYLFVAYLLTLALIFSSSLIPDGFSNQIAVVQRIYLFVGTVAFIMSLLLPGALMKIQLEHHDDVVAHYRKKANITDDE